VKVNSLRFKLIWTHSTAIALIWICVGLVRYSLVSYNSNRNFDDALQGDAQFLVSRLQPGVEDFTLSLEGLSPGLALTLQEMDPYLVITDTEGKVLFDNRYKEFMHSMISSGSLEDTLRQASGFGKAAASDGSEYRFVNFTLPSGFLHTPAVIHVGRSRESLKGVLQGYLAFYLYSVPLMLVISIGVGWLMAGRAIEPFEQITRAMEKITYENLNAQIPTEPKEEELQRLVHSFNAMVQRLNQSFQHMRKFNADAAHELRTPLAILRGETEVALRTPGLPDEIHVVLESNLEELERLTHIVNDMLMLAEAEAGRQVLSQEPVHLNVLLHDLLDQMRLLATDRNLLINLHCAPGLWIDVDKLWIRRAFINLLDNAIKYSKCGGTVEVSATGKGTIVCVTVKDNGIGISPADLPRIFDRLYRADPARSRVSGGAGLGLAMVKWIVEAHKGSIRVTSQPDLGTSFEITLPASSSATLAQGSSVSHDRA
jgi:two-component system, OmpR family, sensor kinase